MSKSSASKTNEHYYDGQALVAAAREVEAPFCITADFGAGSEDVECRQVLRLLPRRRVVALARWRSRDVLAKLFLADAERNVRREREGVEALQSCDIAVPTPLADGSFAGGRVWVSEYLSDAVSPNADELVAAGEATLNHGEPLDELLWCLARMHENGVYYTDLHLDNFLIREGEVVAIDGAAVRRMRRPLQFEASYKQVGSLLAQLPVGGLTLSEAAFDTYAGIRGWVLAPSQRVVAADLADAARRRRVARYLRKTQRDCSAFSASRRRGAWIVCDRSYAANTDLRAIVDDPDTAMAGGEWLKQGNTTTVARVGNFVVKRYNVKGLWHWIRLNLRRSRGRRAWIAGHRLVFQGIKTATPIAVIERRGRLGFRRESYLVTLALEGQELGAMPRTDIDEPLVHAIVRYLRTLESVHVSQRDTKATNFIVDGCEVALIDLDFLVRQTAGRTAKSHQRFLDNFDGELRSQFERALAAGEARTA